MCAQGVGTEEGHMLCFQILLRELIFNRAGIDVSINSQTINLMQFIDLVLQRVVPQISVTSAHNCFFLKSGFEHAISWFYRAACACCALPGSVFAGAESTVKKLINIRP